MLEITSIDRERFETKTPFSDVSGLAVAREVLSVIKLLIVCSCNLKQIEQMPHLAFG